MRSRATHQLNEVPVLTCRVAVTLDVTDNLSVGLASSVEAERSLNLVVLQVAIDSLRTADNLYAVVLGSIVLSQNASVGVRVVTTDDYESLDIKLTQNLDALLKLVFLLKLCTARTDKIETAGVAIISDKLVCNLDVFVVNETARPHKEAIETVLWVQLLNLVKQT